ncbi:hypothetical protein [Nonomuraea sp. NPDC050643]|uniref:hypothetical protein n=1 Tax=Nonomuraea sp. NPDC050643 TaxID=3155660 RepID=UPI00340C9A96
MTERRAPNPRARTTVRRLLSAGLALLAAAFLVAPPAAALAPPTPRDFVSNLDLECFRTTEYQPPSTRLTLRHLNPVLVDQPPVQVVLGPRGQLCVPVAKNGVIPPPGVLDYIRFVDLSCYRVSGPLSGKSLALRHLNPVLQNLPGLNVTLLAPVQLCVPVAKNGVIPGPDVLRVISHIDLLCYAHQPNPAVGLPLTLTQLNPVLTSQIPTRSIRVTAARQLCVPVQKSSDEIPPDVLDLVRWIDLLKFDTDGIAISPVSLNLRHLNPVLANLPGEELRIISPSQLAVPVAKNGVIPPG